MKCLFVESAHEFELQYHSAVVIHDAGQRPWHIGPREEVGEDFRVFRACLPGEQVAVFVPCYLDANQAHHLIREFEHTHPDMLPDHFIRSFWERLRSRLSLT